MSLLVSGLKCYVGLGNSSKKKEQILVDCGEEKHFACVKMFGGGMGDQIRRKCEKLEQTVSHSAINVHWRNGTK